MARTAQVISFFGLLGWIVAGGCRASGTTPFVRPTEDDAGSQVIIEAGANPTPDAPEAAPHALLALEPPHGPFSGGTLVQLRGNGFGSNARVWFGSNQVPESDVVAVGPQQIQVTAPPGAIGSADVVVQNGEDGSTRVELPGGYSYDAFYASPANGPTSGGTFISVLGQGTSWDEETTVFVDREPCEVVEVKSETELVCRTPPGTQGAKSMRVTTSDGVSVDALDAFTYGNSDNGFRGGLSGRKLDGELKVLAFDNIVGSALEGVSVIVGSDDPRVESTDENGIAVISGAEIGPTVTVTFAKKCFQPLTFVDVPVDTITAFLEPLLSPACFSPEGDLPPSGGTPGQGASVNGELIWPQTEEFRRDGWTNVPDPKSEDEHEVAYIFRLSRDASQRFQLPSPGNAVTPISTGDAGFGFDLSVSPGNYTLYALAGLENRARVPYVFTAYSMGLVRGVAIAAGSSVENVFIRIDLPLDHKIPIEFTPPTPTRRGPNRVNANIAVRVGNEGYVLLPGAQSETLLGAKNEISFVGLPPLIRALTGASYVASATATTGTADAMPRSAVGLVGVQTGDEPVVLGPFVEVPVLTDPPTNGLWNARDLSWTSAKGGLAPDLVIVDIATAGALYTWRVVAPNDPESLHLPDLGAVDPELAWPQGAQNIMLVRAHITDFDYGNLRYRDLREGGWTAHAVDTFWAKY